MTGHGRTIRQDWSAKWYSCSGYEVTRHGFYQLSGTVGVCVERTKCDWDNKLDRVGDIFNFRTSRAPG